MRKNIIFTALLIYFLFFTFETVFAQRGTAQAAVVNVRLASTLPRNSEWGRSLDRLAADVMRVTNNQVRLTVNHDGRDGGETIMLSKLSSDAIQAGIFTSAGMTEICPAVMNLSVPFLIRNDSELNSVLRDVLPQIEAQVKNEFVVLTWSKGGWIYLFSKERILTPDDLRRQKLGTSPELTDVNTVFRTMGFQLIETEWTTVGQRLASNVINTVYVTPSIIAPMQLHKNLSHMLEMPIAPVMGAIVMNRVTWNKISPAHQQEILRLTKEMSTGFDNSVTRTEASAISAMGRDGLSVNKPNQTQQNLWQTELQNSMPTLIGRVFDRNIIDRINGILERSRR